MSWQTITKENKLAISEKSLSDTVSAFRFDAEYFQPHYLKNELVIARKDCKTLGDITDDLRSFGAYSLTNQITYQESGIPFVRCTDVKEGYVDFSRVYYIDEITNKLLWKSKVEKGTVLLCMSGSVGNSAVAEDNWIYPVNSNQDIAKIILKVEVNPYFLSAFFNSTYGKLQIMRLPIGSVQQHIFLWQLKTLKVPVASSELQEEVADAYKKALIQQKKAEDRFVEAERLLIKEICLERYEGTDESISVRNFSEALADNRFDAEYWQRNYDVILDTLSKYKKGVSTINDEFKQIKGNFKAVKDEEYNYIEIGDVNVSTGEVEYNSIIGAELPANAKIKFGKRQLITSKVRPNRGATAILNNHEGYIGSGAFTVLTEKDNINLETLMVYLKAKPIRELLLRYNTGTSYPVITDSDVLKLSIPLIDKTVQKKISELVSVSATERQQAKALLEKAKRAVEIFVEKDEKEALKYLSL